jgi:quinol monooxygenase YgiN
MNLTVEIKAGSGKSQELYQTLQALLYKISRERGCRSCRIYRALEDEDIFSLWVQWEAQTNLERFMRSNSGGALLGAIDLLSETARFRIDDASWEGIEILRSLKRKQNTI